MVLIADLKKQIEADKARKAEAERQRPAPGGSAPRQHGQGQGQRRKPGPARKLPAREWLATAAWTAAGLQGIGLFATLSMLADSKSLYLQIGREKLAKLLHCTPSTIGRYLLKLEGLRMIRRKRERIGGGGMVKSILHLWILRPATSTGARLPGLDSKVQGCASAENPAENAPAEVHP